MLCNEYKVKLEIKIGMIIGVYKIFDFFLYI